MDFILEFDSERRAVCSLDKSSKKLIFEANHNGVPIKIISKRAGEVGEYEIIDMSSTSIEIIEEAAFDNCNKLTKVIFPQSLHTLESNSFCSTKLTNIIIPSNVKSMTGCVWNQIPSVESFNVDTENQFFSSLNGYLFNKDLTSLIRAPVSVVSESDIPNIKNIVSIGCFAFTTTNLKTFACTSNVVSLEYFCFHAIFTVKKIDLSLGKFKSIPHQCFRDTNAEEILLPKTVTSVCEKAFFNMRNLKVLVCYDRINHIEKDAFKECPELKIIYFTGRTDFSSIECIGSNVNATVFVSYKYPVTKFCNVSVSKIFIQEIATCVYRQISLIKQMNFFLIFTFTYK